MRLVVDLTRCQGYGQCAYFAPDVCRIGGKEGLTDDPEPDEGQRERVLRSVAACPVHAIRLERIDDRGAAAAATPAFAATVPTQRTAPSMLAAGVEAFRRTGRIVVVGASLAGLAAAGGLRREGFAGSLTLIGGERDRPYDRPPPAKQGGDGRVRADHTWVA